MTIAVQKKHEKKKHKILLLLLFVFSFVKEQQWNVSLRNTGKRV